MAYRPDRCLGCRYCMVSCPFGVPRFEWHNGLTPEIRKCMFCIERQRQGELPACAANCPSGALKVGTRDELLKEAHARIAANPSFYVDHVFGEQEAGGTAMLYISDVPFEMLGFRTDVTTRPVPGLHLGRHVQAARRRRQPGGRPDRRLGHHPPQRQRSRPRHAAVGTGN